MRVVLPHREVGRDRDTQPQFLDPPCHTLCLELSEPFLWPKDRDKCEGDRVGSEEVSGEGDLQDEGVAPAHQCLTARQEEAFGVVPLWSLMTRQLHTSDLQ